MGKGNKYLTSLLVQEKKEKIGLRSELVKYRNRILLLESKLLSIDFSLKNWYRQKIKKQDTQKIINL